MMKIRTLTDLDHAMSEEFAWRKREFQGVKAWVESNEHSRHRNAAIRAGVAMVYAHWEGFIKNIGTQYLEFVSRQRLPNSKLTTAFLALSMGSTLDDAIASKKTELRRAVVSFFRDRIDERSHIPWQSKVQTRSNLTSSVLREIMRTLGLDYGPFQTKEKLIDTQLVDSRNHIAHGEYLLVTTEAYFFLHGAVLEMMDEFYRQVQNAALTGAYMMPVTTTGTS